MAELTSAKRNKIPTKQFAGPNRSYPIEDRAHAANAKARATQQEHAGNLSPEEAAQIKARADRKLGETKSKLTNALTGKR